jgi:6-methylsalicylate decarboxylase
MSSKPAGRQLGRIDVHHHYHMTYPAHYTPTFEPVRAGRVPGGMWSPELHLGFMDKWGIEAAILSDPAVPMLELDRTERRTLTRELNDFNATLIEKHGSRFGTFAAMPMPDVEASVVEARRALTELGLDGIFLGTHSFGRYLGDESFEPFYAELNRLKAVVYVHPTPMFCVPSVPYLPGVHHAQPMLEFVFETTRTMASLVYSGVPRRHPDIRWIFSHGGGAIPLLAFRFEGLHTYESRYNEVLPEGPLAFFKQFYYETAQAISRAQLDAVKAIAPTEHILFGTDYPPLRNLYADNNREQAKAIAPDLPTAAGDPAPSFDIVFGEERVKVERLNALSLFPKLAARLKP